MKVHSPPALTGSNIITQTRREVIRHHSRAGTILALVTLMLFALMTVGPLKGVAFGASAPAVNQCNGTDNVGGEAVACRVTVTNNLDQATGVTSSTLTVQECHGAANAPPTCTDLTTSSTQLITSVTQCNGSGNGGGGTVTCEVNVVNNITGTATPTSATVNQCNTAGEGGGTEPTLSCSPIGDTTNATVTQCNESGNGGGGTMRVKCDVTSSTETSALPVLINQCVGSGNGGGATVTCTVSLTNNVTPPPVTPRRDSATGDPAARDPATCDAPAGHTAARDAPAGHRRP